MIATYRGNDQSRMLGDDEYIRRHYDLVQNQVRAITFANEPLVSHG